MSGWPDPENPGVPLHPEVDGFHWLGNAAFVWAAKFGNWALNGAGFPPEFFATTAYLGPCLTPTEADALRAENARLRGALADMHAGWRYIRLHYGDLSGVGWERCDAAARAALEVKP
jgi:hypothetical protein